MFRRVAAGVETAQREAAAREARRLLTMAQVLNGAARRLLRRRWRPVAWAMCRTAESMARMAWRIWKRELRGRR